MFPITYTPIGTVESALRCLCSGACRAWSRLPEDALTDLDAAPRDCAHLQARARSLLLSALEQLGIPEERWREVGLGGLESVGAEPGLGRDPIGEGGA